MNLAVIGSGGREHAICYKLKQSPKIKKLICLPGNAGIEEIAENVAVDISNFDLIYEILKKYKIDIVVVGPEQPLVDGFVNYLNEKKIRVFGPDKFCSQLEGSKAFMKSICKLNNIPTAKFKVCKNKNDVKKFLQLLYKEISSFEYYYTEYLVIVLILRLNLQLMFLYKKESKVISLPDVLKFHE